VSVAAVRAEMIESGRITADMHVERAERGGQANAVDVKEIRGRRPDATVRKGASTVRPS
jgi:hypothetical protein